MLRQIVLLLGVAVVALLCAQDTTDIVGNEPSVFDQLMSLLLSQWEVPVEMVSGEMVSRAGEPVVVSDVLSQQPFGRSYSMKDQRNANDASSTSSSSSSSGLDYIGTATLAYNGSYPSRAYNVWRSSHNNYLSFDFTIVAETGWGNSTAKFDVFGLNEDQYGDYITGSSFDYEDSITFLNESNISKGPICVKCSDSIADYLGSNQVYLVLDNTHNGNTPDSAFPPVNSTITVAYTIKVTIYISFWIIILIVVLWICFICCLGAIGLCTLVIVVAACLGFVAVIVGLLYFIFRTPSAPRYTVQTYAAVPGASYELLDATGSSEVNRSAPYTSLQGHGDTDNLMHYANPMATLHDGSHSTQENYTQGAYVPPALPSTSSQPLSTAEKN
jgi:hypothetical protein